MDPVIEPTEPVEPIEPVVTEPTEPTEPVEAPDAATDFDSAFEDAMSANEPVDTPPKVDPKPTPPVAEPVAPAVKPDVVPAPADVVPPVAADPAPAVVAPEPAPVPAPALDPAFLAQAIAEANRKLAEANAPAPEPAKPLTKEDFYTPEDKVVVDKFKAEWPDEQGAVQRMIDAQVQAIVGNRLNTLVTQLNGVLAPLQESTTLNQQNTFAAYVNAKHPDAAAMQPQIADWIKTQPAITQPALQLALDQGNAQQVVQLLDMYKQAIGQTGAAVVPPASLAAQETTPPKKAGPSPAAVAALTAVPAAQRTAPTARPDENDFDGAFAEAVVKLG